MYKMFKILFYEYVERNVLKETFNSDVFFQIMENEANTFLLFFPPLETFSPIHSYSLQPNYTVKAKQFYGCPISRLFENVT